MIRKVKENLSLLPLIARKSNNYRESNQEKVQRKYTKNESNGLCDVTFKKATEKMSYNCYYNIRKKDNFKALNIIL